jgi:hypothetical protein
MTGGIFTNFCTNDQWHYCYKTHLFFSFPDTLNNHSLSLSLSLSHHSSSSSSSHSSLSLLLAWLIFSNGVVASLTPPPTVISLSLSSWFLFSPTVISLSFVVLLSISPHDLCLIFVNLWLYLLDFL